MLNIKHLDAYYGESIILRDVNMEVPPGKIVCLMGRNGVGKTTLLKCIMGLLQPRAGNIIFAGIDITRSSPDERVKLGLGYVPQGRDIFPQLTVYENLLLGLEARKDGGNAIPEDIFELFPVLKPMLNRKGGDLSGGQQQQLAIARALAGRPKLLLLDEPTEGIQPSIILEIAKAIRSIKAASDVSVLLVEQYLEFVLDMGDYYYIMEKGSIVSQGLIAELGEQVIKEHLAI
ncbi:MAG: urea ABC transporter ATP-binding subunit UrtE [Peptococcaceae bacterium]|nr:urea ABC transporter ATP-binding subunit UrtE [Peptococcaceae bacterium]